MTSEREEMFILVDLIEQVMCPEYPPCNIILQVGWLKFVCPGNRQFYDFQFLSRFSCNFRHRLDFEHLD